jgi:hypothetical protein
MEREKNKSHGLTKSKNKNLKSINFIAINVNSHQMK